MMRIPQRTRIPVILLHAAVCLSLAAALPPRARADGDGVETEKGRLLEVSEWGEYRGVESACQPERRSNEGCTSIVTNLNLVQKTHSICAKLGTRFGFRYQFAALAPYRDLRVTVDIYHPALANRFGRRQYLDAFDAIVTAGQSQWAGWNFRNRQNLLDGTWRFVVRQGNDILLRQQFDVSFSCVGPIAGTLVWAPLAQG